MPSRRPMPPRPRGPHPTARPRPQPQLRQAPRESEAGFAIGVYHQSHIEENARERIDPRYGDADLRREWIAAGWIDKKGAITAKGWALLNQDIDRAEHNSLEWLRKKFQHARDDGHDSHDDLVGSFWFDPTNPEHAELIDLASSSPGRSERIDMSDASFGDLADTAFDGVSDLGGNVLGGQIVFYGVKPEDWAVIEATNDAEYQRERQQRRPTPGAGEPRSRGVGVPRGGPHVPSVPRRLPGRPSVPSRKRDDVAIRPTARKSPRRR